MVLPSAKAFIDGYAAANEQAPSSCSSALGAFDRWLWQHHLRPATISKFGTGLAAIRPDLPANTWHRTIARHWRVQACVPIDAASAALPLDRRRGAS